jgi:hypothetical protein
MLGKIGNVISTLFSIFRPFIMGFLKTAGIVGIAIGAFVFLKNVFQELEKRTKIFSSIYKVMSDELANSASAFKPLITFFSQLGEKIKEVGSKAFGLFVFGLAKVIESINALVLSNPFGVFSEKTISSIAAINGRLKSFSGDLQAVAFDISKIPAEAERSIASVGDKSAVNLEEVARKLNSLRENLRNTGLTDTQVIERDQAESLETLRLAFENKLLLEQEYLDLRNKVNLDSLEKLRVIEDKSNKERQSKLDQANRIINQSLGNAISGGIQNVVASLAKGKSVFAEFGNFLIGMFGDLAIQLGQFYIADGLAKLALLAISPAAQIAAGASLIALGAIMKSFVSGGASGGGGTAAIGAQPRGGEFSTQTDGLADPEAVKDRAPQTNVEIVVQGSLVQQEELGQFITKTLNESFSKQGVTLTDARFA